MLTATRRNGSGNPARVLRLPVALLVLGHLWASTGRAADTIRTEPPRLEPWRLRGEAFEERRAWLEACRCYEDALRKERSNAAAREGYQRSLRRLHLANRHADAAYRESVARLTPVQAMETYEQILSILRVAYPDRTRTNLQQMFQQGLQELRFALEEPRFLDHHRLKDRPGAVAAYRKRLANWSARVTSLSEARDQALLAVRSAARDGLTLRPALVSAFTLEFAAGACNTLDDFTSFLTPGTLTSVQAALGGKLFSVGVELGVVEERLVVTRVYPKSPAQLAGIFKGDRLLKVGGQSVEDLPADAAAERLRGKKGSVVEVVIVRADRSPRSVRLERRAYPVSSVESRPIDVGYGMQAGYVQIHHFQDSTFQEVKDALTAMASTGDPVKGVILDLRGNPGGLFKSAVAVAELFLGAGVIVVGQSPLKDYNQHFKVETPGPIALPMVVLIDGETASAAEVLAGALKESRPAATTVLLGQTTFGKGSVQRIILIEKSPLDRFAAIRLSVARLLSPTSQPISGRGVSPGIPSELDGEALLSQARQKLTEMINTPMAPPRMPSMMGGSES